MSTPNKNTTNPGTETHRGSSGRLTSAARLHHRRQQGAIHSHGSPASASRLEAQNESQGVVDGLELL
jgi:hypothetical protein